MLWALFPCPLSTLWDGALRPCLPCPQKVPNVQKTLTGVIEWGKAELEEMKKKAPKQN